MTNQELNTLQHICELGRTQLLTISSMYVQMAGYFINGNRSNPLYLQKSTAWFYGCPHFLSPLYETNKFFDCIPI